MTMGCARQALVQDIEDLARGIHHAGVVAGPSRAAAHVYPCLVSGPGTSRLVCVDAAFYGLGLLGRRTRPMTNDTAKKTRKRTKRNCAMVAAPEAMPPNPKTAAIDAITKNTAAQYNMSGPF